MADAVVPFDYLERVKRQPARWLDPVNATVAAVRAEQVQRTILDNPDPERVSRVTTLARRIGDPTLEVEGREGEVQTALNAREFHDLVSVFPPLSSWATDNPRGVAAASDDIRSLRRIASAFDPDELSRGWSIKAPSAPEPTLLNSVKGVWQSLLSGYAQTNLGLTAAIGDWLGKPSYVSQGSWDAAKNLHMRDIRAQQARVDSARPAFKSTLASDLYGGVSSTAQMVPAIAASIATRSPIPAVTIAGLQSGGSAYGKYRSRGGTVREATLGAAIEGGAEAAFEVLPMGTVAKRFGTSGVGRFAGEYLGKEMITEQLTTLVQDAADTAIANPHKTWAEYWAERPAAARETAVAVLVGSGVMAGASSLAARATRRQDMRVRATAEGHFLDDLAEGVSQSKLRERDPESFRAMMARLTADMLHDRVYIPADAVRSYMQSERFEDSDFWREQEENISTAEAIGGDVVLPVADVMTHLSGKAAWNALRSEMRLSPGGLSRSEAEGIQDERGIMESEMDGMLAERSNDARSRLFAVAYQKLIDAGTAPGVARVQAEVVSHRYSARTERLGQPMTGAEFNDVDVQQILPEKMRAAAKADATDLVINALRLGKPAMQKNGPSLIEWIVRRGGINDTGGDLRSIGLDQWHRQKPFRGRAIRDYDPRQGGLDGLSGGGDFGLDTTLRAAVEEGFFPELSSQLEQAYGNDSFDPQVLIDAISDEVAGNPRYSTPQVPDQIREAAGELEQMLLEAGHDPAQMGDSDIRDFLDRFGRGDSAGRSYKSGERGRILFTEDGKSIIQLFRSRNTSTFLHESGHLFLEELRQDAMGGNAPEALRRDWQTVREWFAASGHAVAADGTISTEAHELWARGFERYLMEGKSPSQGLARAFETMRSWLVGIYRRIANLKSPITDDVRAVMDRLLATDEEISDMRSEQALEATFGDASAAGMTESEFAAYMDLVASAKGTANSELLGRTIARLKAAETQRYRDQEAEVRGEVTRAVDMRPPFRALDLVRSSPLNKQWIVDRFGADAVKLMPAGVPATVKDNGAHPDSVAEAAGFATGRDMIEALMGLEKRRREMRKDGDKRTVREATITSEVDDVMAERYGDPFATGEIEAEALSAVHNDMQGEVLAAEVRALARRTGRRPTPYAMAREWARRHVRSGEVRDHLSGAALQQYRRAAAMNSRAAFQAVADGDFLTAFQHKQAQLVNNALVREAREAMRDVEAAVKRLDRAATRKKIDGVEQSYLEQAHALLEEVDLRQRSGRQIDRQSSFEAWASAREDEGHTIAVPKSFATTIGKTNWTKLSAENLLGLEDAVKQMLHLGRLKQTLMDNQEQRELDKVVGEALTTIERLPPREAKGFEDPTKWDDIKSRVLGTSAALLKMEQVFKRLDGGKHGAFNRVVFQPISEAQAREHAMIKEVLGELDGHLKALPKPIVESWHDQIEIPELYDPRTKLPMKGPRSRLISIALNMGNDSNAQKLVGGYNWDQARVQDVLDKQLAPEEWRYVQNVWDTIEKMWPAIEALERRVNGIVPEKVRPRTLTTSAGVLQGVTSLSSMTRFAAALLASTRARPMVGCSRTTTLSLAPRVASQRSARKLSGRSCCPWTSSAATSRRSCTI